MRVSASRIRKTTGTAKLSELVIVSNAQVKVRLFFVSLILYKARD